MPNLRNQISWVAIGRLILLFAVVSSQGIVFSGRTCGQIDQQVFSPPPGFLTRPLDQAKNALANEDYSTAVESLAVLLGLESSTNDKLSEDYFLPTNRKFATRSIRREASKLVADMPARGRAVFELKYGITAEKRLSEAVETNDRSKLMAVSRKYFHTRAGHVATYLLGREKLFQGDFQFAGRYLEKLYQNESAREALDPELTILAAIASAGSGRQDSAIAKLMSLKDQHPNLRFVWGDEVITHTIVDAESAGQFLKELVTEFPKTSSFTSGANEPNDREWLSPRSDSNLSLGADDSILPIPDWSVNSVPGKDLNTIEDIVQQRIQTNAPAIPSSHAIALKNTVIFRGDNRVYAVDVRTGKRTWMYPWSHQQKDPGWTEPQAVDEKKINRKLWSDSIQSKITSDGERIFFVESNDFGFEGRFPNSSLLQGQTILDPRNSLVALKVLDEQGFGVEGQLAWKIDTRNDDPDLSGAIFLGPPLLKDQTAYVLYERSGQIRVAALDSATGKVNWSQQIASTQSHDGYDQRLFRYRSASSPVFANGLLICPTMVGGLVAIDLTDLSLKWGFKYNTLNESRYIQGFDSAGSFTPWLDDALFILDEFICFSPVDSRDYYLIRVESGKTKIVRPKEDHWVLAGKFNDFLVLIGPSSLTLNPLNGFSSFKVEYEGIGEPVGTGLFSGKHFYIPFSKSQLVKVDLEKRKVVEVIETAFQLGNLSQYRGRLYSRSATGLQAYWLKRAAMATKQVNSENVAPTDASGWLVKAQLHDSEEQNNQAIESMIRSINLTSTSMSQAYLAKLLIKQINRGASIDWQLMQRGFDLLESPEHQRAYLLAKIESRFAAGQGQGGNEDLVALIDLYGPEFQGDDDLITMSRDHSVAGLRLVRSRLQKSVESLSEADQEKLVAEFQSRFNKALAAGDLRTLRTYTEIFGGFDFVSRQADDLLKAIFAANRHQDMLWVQNLFLDILQRMKPNDDVDDSARLRLLHGLVQVKSKLYSSKDTYSQDLLRGSLKSLAQLVSKLEIDSNSKRQKEATDLINKQLARLGKPPEHVFPDGMTRIEMFEDTDLDLLFVDAQERRYSSLKEHSNRMSPLNFRVEFDDRGYFLIRDETGKLVYQGDSRTPGSRHANRRYDQSQYQIHGDLLILSCGYDHVALDLSKIASLQPGQISVDESDLLVGESSADVAVLWRFNAFQPSKSRGMTRMRRESNTIGIVSRELFDSNGARVCKTGFLSSSGYCFLSGDTVYCLDPWSGRVCWKRSGIAAGSDLLGDETHVYVISSDDRKVDVYSKLDGTNESSLAIPANMINRFSHHGPFVFSLREVDDSIFIYGFKISTEKVELIWTKQFPKRSKAELVNKETMAVLSPDGQFRMIHLSSGKTMTEFQANTDDLKVASIQVIQFGEQFLLIANQNSYSKIESSRSELGFRTRPVVAINGSLILFGKSGPIWKGAARIDGFELVLNQPAIAPVLMLKRLNKEEQTTDLVFVRRSDGSLIHYDKPISHTGTTTNVRYHADRKCLTFNLGYHWLALTVTSHPRPPEPPAQTGKYSSLPKRPTEKVKSPNLDPFAESNGDIFQTSRKSIKEWVNEAWKNNPMNPKRAEREPMKSDVPDPFK